MRRPLRLLRAAFYELLRPPQLPPLVRIPPLRRIPELLPSELVVPDAAIAELCSEVERSKVIAGGVTTANFPQVAKNLRRSSSASWEEVGISVMATPIKIKINHRAFKRSYS